MNNEGGVGVAYRKPYKHGASLFEFNLIIY